MLSTSSSRKWGRRSAEATSLGRSNRSRRVSDLYCPVSGEVVEVNTALDTMPESVNQQPHESWMIVLKLTDPTELSDLHDAEGYAKLIG